MEENNMARKRKQYTGKEKLAILRKHLLEGVAVSDICDENGLQPTVFYRWQKQLFEEGSIVFRRTNEGRVDSIPQDERYRSQGTPATGDETGGEAGEEERSIG